MIPAITAFFTSLTAASNAFVLGVQKLDEFFAWQKEIQAQKLSDDIADLRNRLSVPTTPTEKQELAKKLGEITSRIR